MSETGWHFWENDNCPFCGNIAEVNSPSSDWAWDGDEARCCECGCPGWIDCDSETDAIVVWHDEPAGTCACDWCNKMNWWD